MGVEILDRSRADFEAESNRLSAVFETTGRTWEAETAPTDVGLAPDRLPVADVAAVLRAG